MAVTGLRTIACLIFYLIVVINAQYKDDSDYKDLTFYEDMPINYVDNFEKDDLNIVQDDFYILGDFEDAGVHGDVYSTTNDNLVKKKTSPAQLDWYKPKRVYRYTKHRIPGYDYEELHYAIARNVEQCDERSVWTHCLCQFTCEEPDVVDCYTPCSSGCECKEEYVFDEITQQCTQPEHCTSKDADFY